MKLLHYFYIIIILHRNALVLAEDDEEVFRLTDTLTRCSHLLSKVIDEFCSNIYKIVKRDTSSVVMDKLVPEDLHEHIKRERLKRWRRVRRQVATECCEQPCTVGNILLYCPPNAAVLKEHPDLVD